VARAPSALYKASSCQSEELFEGARLWPVLMMCDHCRAPPADWKFQRRLGDLSPTQLGAIPVREVVKRANLEPQQMDERIMSNAVAAGVGQNPAQ